MYILSRSRYFYGVGVVLLALGARDAAAFETYGNGCNFCHPGFEGGFGSPLHDAHMIVAKSNCSLCHVVPGDDPKMGIKDPLIDRGCVGCHGRLEDMGSDGLGPGLGAGLAQHHTNFGIDECTECHTMANPAIYTPVGEDVVPPFYVKGLASNNDPCTDNLDNDGDLLEDDDDPDCATSEAPVADPNGPYTGVVGAPVLFDGTGSTDDGTIVSYDWDFGDGNTDTGVSPSHTYTAAGEYTVSLTVTDDDGFTDTATTTASITETENLPPVADAGGPYEGTVGQPVQFDGTASSDPDGTVSVYLWDFGDGGADVGPTPTHTYNAAGTYPVTLTVADDDGAMASDTTTVEITDEPPPPAGNVWMLRVSSGTAPGYIELLVETEEFGGVLWIDETYSDTAHAFGIGMESGGFLFWMDSLGALFYGNVNHDDGTMMGIVFDFLGYSSFDRIFFGEQ